MQITKVHHEGEEDVYKVVDETALQGQFFVIVNREEKTLSVSSMDLDGVTDEADLILISSRLPLEQPEMEDDAAGWGYIDAADLAKKLLGLLGEHSAIILQDLGGDSVDTNSPEWQDAIATAVQPASSDTPDMVSVGGQEFEFDPDQLKAGDPAGDPDGADGGDMDFGMNDPGGDDLPPADDEDPLPGDEDEEEDEELPNPDDEEEP